MSKESSSSPEAEEELRQKILVGSVNPEEHRKLADLLFRVGSHEEAGRLFERALELALTILQKARASIDLGWSLYMTGEQARALTLAENALRLLMNEEDSPQVWACRGACQVLLAHCEWGRDTQSGKWLIGIESDKRTAQLALEYLERATKDAPEFEGKATAFYDAANLHSLLGNTTKAIALCEQCLQCELDDWERASCLTLYGEALRKAGRFEEAERKIGEALRHAERYKTLLPKLYIELGLIQCGTKRLPEAQQTFRQALLALEADPSRRYVRQLYTEAYMNLGGTCYELGDFRGAAAAYEEVLHGHSEDNPCECSARLWLGHCYRTMGYHAKARDCFEKVLASLHASKEEELGARENLAMLKYELRDYERALAEFLELHRSCAKDDPVRPNRILWIGHCYEGLKDYAKAQESYEEVLTSPHALDGDKESAHEGLKRLPPSAKQTVH